MGGATKPILDMDYHHCSTFYAVLYVPLKEVAQWAKTKRTMHHFAPLPFSDSTEIAFSVHV